MATYLVTGGAGFIGSHVVEALAQHGHVVRVVDNFSTGRHANLNHLPQVIIIEGDVRDAATVHAAAAGADYMIHLAAMVSVPQSMSDPVGSHAVNVTGTLNILQAAREFHIKRVVLASSCAVYGDNDALPLSESAAACPLSPYAATKLMAETYCQLFYRVYGIPTVCLRFFNVYGPRQDPASEYAAVIPRFVQRMQHGQAPIIFGDGTQTRDFVHVSDVVKANLIVCEREVAVGQVFNVASGRGISLLELIDILNQVLGTSIAPTFARPRAGDLKHSRGDAQRMASMLSFRPTVSLAEGLASVAAAALVKA